jgi:hypothetical protein
MTRRSRQLKGFDVGCQLLKGFLEHMPGQMTAETAVRSITESDVPVR